MSCSVCWFLPYSSKCDSHTTVLGTFGKMFVFNIISQTINKLHLTFEIGHCFPLLWGRKYSFSLDISMKVFYWRSSPASVANPPDAVPQTSEDVIMQLSDTCPCTPRHNVALKKQQIHLKSK